MRMRILTLAALALVAASTAVADRFELITGVDARLSPGTARSVPPLGMFVDGDRLAGTADRGGTVSFLGVGTPLYQPNEFGSLSFLFRRGSVPLFPSGRLAFLGIEFLGGPLLDLDGDLSNGVRSLTPVAGQSPLAIPGSASYIDLTFDSAGGSVALNNIDVTGTNEGAPGVQAAIATVLLVRSNTSPTGQLGVAINPQIDTRSGSLTDFLTQSGVATVQRISNLGYEFWEDSIDSNSSTASTLGTFQFLGNARGWHIRRHPQSGSFPTLAGIGLGTTLWPLVDTSQVGNAFVTANGLAGGIATIGTGPTADDFTLAGNGGLVLSDFGGDLGAYLDAVVVPALPFRSARFVYLEAAGFGINNSFDPVFTDTVGYDLVLIAARPTCPGDIDYNERVDEADLGVLLAAWQSGAAGDLDNDADTDEADLGILLANWQVVCP